MTSPVSAAPAASASGARLVSLDALRGFDMFWILGADAVAYALREMDDNAVTVFFATQLDHALGGFHVYDLIFPLFIFIVGVSLVFSLRRRFLRHSQSVRWRKRQRFS